MRTSVRDLAELALHALRGNVTNALAAGAELKPLGLTDSLELLLLLRDKTPDKYGSAALRWHSRFVREVRGVELEEAQAVLATLAALGGPRPIAAAFALGDLLSGLRGLDRACEILIAWGSR